MAFDFLIGIWVVLFGAVVGSFANVVIYRLPYGQRSITFGRSECFSCQKTIKWYDLIPVLSYFMLRGKCRFCKAPFSARYPLVETLSALLALAAFLRFGATLFAVEFFVFAILLLIIGFIDYDTWLIPSTLCIWLGVTGFSFGVYFGDFLARLIGAASGSLVLLAVLAVSTWFFRKSGRIGATETAMGYGDPLLLMGIGAYVGWRPLPLLMLLASIQSLVSYVPMSRVLRKSSVQTDWSPPGQALPFGPFLALAAIEIALMG